MTGEGGIPAESPPFEFSEFSSSSTGMIKMGSMFSILRQPSTVNRQPFFRSVVSLASLLLKEIVPHFLISNFYLLSSLKGSMFSILRQPSTVNRQPFFRSVYNLQVVFTVR
jgi:hypothetical protein